MSTSPLPPLDRLFHSSSDNYMEIFLDAPFRFSSCFKLILGTSPIHSYKSFTCSLGAEDQTKTLELVLKSVNCRDSLLQQVKLLICEILYSTSLDCSLQFKCSLNSPTLPVFPLHFVIFFHPKLSNAIFFLFLRTSVTLPLLGLWRCPGILFWWWVTPFFLQLVWNNREWTALFIARRHQLHARCFHLRINRFTDYHPGCLVLAVVFPKM